MSDEVLVKVEGVSKKFCRSLKKSLWYGLQDIAADLNPFGKNGSANGLPASPLRLDVPRPSDGRGIKGEGKGGQGEVSNSNIRLRPDEFWAVNDVCFELRRGECLGLIGRNGAGKTTLLKMLNGLIKPDSGRITMRGRVGALIALGAGFNPILTGRENIYVNASVLGLTKRETEARIDEIIDFADIGDFIDTPVQSYSSGMQVRLGFAVATALEPDVLLLDEVLAVGDAAFRHKCYHRLYKLMSRAAVILVSHSMEYIAQTCNTIAMMRRGQAQVFLDTTEGITAYNEDNSTSGTPQSDEGRVEAVYPPVRRAQVRLLTPEVAYGGHFLVEVEIDCEEEMPDMVFAFTAVNLNEQPVMCWHTSRRPGRVGLLRGRQFLRFSIAPLFLHDGTYHWSFNAARRGKIEHVIWITRGGQFSVTSPFRPVGNIPYLVDTSAYELVLDPASPGQTAAPVAASSI